MQHIQIGMLCIVQMIVNLRESSLPKNMSPIKIVCMVREILQFTLKMFDIFKGITKNSENLQASEKIGEN